LFPLGFASGELLSCVLASACTLWLSEARADTEAHANAVSHTRRQGWLRELCQEAGADDPDALAQQLGLLIDGALASGRLLQERHGITPVAVARDGSVRPVRRPRADLAERRRFSSIPFGESRKAMDGLRISRFEGGFA
jgi:hypothetical protein